MGLIAIEKLAKVEPGATLADLDKTALAHGLATPLGINSTTGIAGLTLGGGFGWLTRKCGMTIDNLVSAQMVTADGRLNQLSPEQNRELFWAIRGGGGNFGVITRFEFALHPVAPDILAGLLVFPIDQADSVLPKYRDFVKSAPEEFNAWVILRQAPPLPFLPAEVHGKKVIVLAVFHAGEISAGQRSLEGLPMNALTLSRDGNACVLSRRNFIRHTDCVWLRTLVFTCFAMVAFAANSILCRLA
jgi:FAD/FMN-containing dehydrogenase